MSRTREPFESLASTMASPDPTAETLEFGRFRLFVRRRELFRDGAPVELGSRAFDLLMTLVEAGGALVTKDELLHRVWPNIIVEENTLQSHIHALRKALGSDRDLIMTVPGRGYRFVGDIRPDDSRALSDDRSGPNLGSELQTSPAHRPGNLPAGLSSMIGRAEELKEILALLGAHRLTTLTGPGGIGKTRLALDAARSMVSAFRHGVWLVELGALSDPELVGAAVLMALGLQSSAIDMSLKQLTAAFGDRQMLLVLDNCEHVVNAVARTAEDLLRAAATVRILATSREPLGVEGEMTYQVPPLAIPPGDVRNLDEVLGHEAAQLLVARAKANASDFSLRDENAKALAAICRRLDGIPLAIELAAARVSALGVDAVAARLDQLFDLLSRGHRTALARQQTLRATLDWSYGLLPEDQRVVLRRISVFAGWFTLNAANAVLADPGQPESGVIDYVTDLVAKSLVVAETGGEPRFRLLETTRAYAQRRLEDSGESETLRRRHAEYYRDILTAREHPGAAQGGWLVASAREVDNVRAALTWAFGPAGDLSLAISLAASSVPSWFEVSLPGECQAWMKRAIANTDAAGAAGTRVEMLVQAGLGMALTISRPEGEVADAALLRALDLAKTLDDKDCQLRVLNSLVLTHLRRAEIPAAMMYARKLEGVATHLASCVGIATALRSIGACLYFFGDVAGAHKHLEAAIKAAVPISERRYAMRFGFDYRVSARSFLANVLWLKGFPDQATDMMNNAIAEARETGHVLSLCHALMFGGALTALKVGDFAAADRYTGELLDRAEEVSSESYRAYGLTARALVVANKDGAAPAIEQLRGALTGAREANAWFLSLMFSADFAESLAACDADEAMTVIEEGLRLADASGGHLAVAELLRVKGELHLATGGLDSQRAAEQSFMQAIDWARRLGALSLELRAATGLARLRRQQGRTATARDTLAPVCARFSEGLQTLDLKRAKALLEELS